MDNTSSSSLEEEGGMYVSQPRPPSSHSLSRPLVWVGDLPYPRSAFSPIARTVGFSFLEENLFPLSSKNSAFCSLLLIPGI
jgi:hypothetical protein